ncbi:MAG: hypothetical protein D6732_17505 [Methanobacteriota archaeon]|nr:MAG: hypothetical protein D6732_17505 [Euryarchaeota archaeon]
MDDDLTPKVRILDALQLVARSLKRKENIFLTDLPRIKMIAADLMNKHIKHELQLSKKQYDAIVTILGHQSNFSEQSENRDFNSAN